MTPMVDGDRRIYQSSRRRWLIATSLVALLLAGSSLIFEKDPDTGLVPVPGDYLWVVLPGAILILVLAWRALKVQVVTDRRGVEIVRVVGRERVPWSRLRRFEVHPTPGKQGTVVLARTDDEVLVKVSSEVMVRPMRNRDEARRLARIRSDALADQLEEDRAMRRSALLSAAAAKVAASKGAEGAGSSEGTKFSGGTGSSEGTKFSGGTGSSQTAEQGRAMPPPSSTPPSDGDPPPGPQSDTSTGPGD